MLDSEKAVYSKLYDIVAENKKNSGAEFEFTKKQFLDEVGQEPPELKGIKGHIIYLVLKLAKVRWVQRMLQKMPKWILNIGRKIVG